MVEVYDLIRNNGHCKIPPGVLNYSLISVRDFKVISQLTNTEKPSYYLHIEPYILTCLRNNTSSDGSSRDVPINPSIAHEDTWHQCYISCTEYKGDTSTMQTTTQGAYYGAFNSDNPEGTDKHYSYNGNFKLTTSNAVADYKLTDTTNIDTMLEQIRDLYNGYMRTVFNLTIGNQGQDFNASIDNGDGDGAVDYHIVSPTQPWVSGITHLHNTVLYGIYPALKWIFGVFDKRTLTDDEISGTSFDIFLLLVDPSTGDYNSAYTIPCFALCHPLVYDTGLMYYSPPESIPDKKDKWAWLIFRPTVITLNGASDIIVDFNNTPAFAAPCDSDGTNALNIDFDCLTVDDSGAVLTTTINSISHFKFGHIIGIPPSYICNIMPITGGSSATPYTIVYNFPTNYIHIPSLSSTKSYSYLLCSDINPTMSQFIGLNNEYYDITPDRAYTINNNLGYIDFYIRDLNLIVPATKTYSYIDYNLGTKQTITSLDIEQNASILAYKRMTINELIKENKDITNILVVVEFINNPVPISSNVPYAKL